MLPSTTNTLTTRLVRSTFHMETSLGVDARKQNMARFHEIPPRFCNDLLSVQVNARGGGDSGLQNAWRICDGMGGDGMKD